MKIMLTNDDGIDAEGLRALAAAAAPLGDLFTIAPHVHQSGCSHRVTTDQPLRVLRHGHGWWAVDGTPADCVRVGLAHLVPEADWILSGLNHGGNLGADVHISGTVAAVREGVLHGKPGIAVSQYRKRNQEIDWDRASRWVSGILADLIARPWEPGTFWNINLPHLGPDDPEPTVLFCPLETAPLPLSFLEENGGFRYNGNYHLRSRQQGSDVDVCFRGHIAVTRLMLF